MASHTKTAGEVRGKVILGDAVVKAEIEFINDAIEDASDLEKVKTVISTGAGMAGVYNYGDWFLLEEVYLYGSGWKGKTEFTSVQRIPGITEMTMKEVQAAIKAIDPNIFVNHKRINAVLSHFRKFGYQIHPGNWFDATSSNKIKWVINWNNTVFDHITVMDDTLIIGKPDQLAPVGAKTATGELMPSGQPRPIDGLIEPIHHQTKIEFYGMGNKGTGQTPMRPAAAGTNNEDYEMANVNIGDGSEFNVGGGSAASAGAAIAQVLAVVNSLQGHLNTSFGQLTQTGLIRCEVDGDYALAAGKINTGDGVTQDLEHYNTYDPAGNQQTGENLGHTEQTSPFPITPFIGGGGGGGGGGGSSGGSSGGGSGNLSFSFTQTSMPCAGCGWLFTSSKLVVTGTSGSASASGPGFLVKVGRGSPTVKFGISKSSVGTVTSARLYLTFHTGEGIANGDYSSVVKVYGNGGHIATYTAGQVKGLGYSKSKPNFNFDVTSFVKSAL
jgi:hypothetical protein